MPELRRLLQVATAGFVALLLVIGSLAVIHKVLSIACAQIGRVGSGRGATDGNR